MFLKFGIIALALIALCAILAWKWQGPHYKGRTLESWVSLIDPARPGNSQDPEVIAAIEHFGSNAVPHIVELLASGDPPEWRRKLWRLVQRHRRLNPWTAAARKPAQAVEAFRILGTKAELAIPRLAPFLLNHNTSVSAGLALIAIGPGPDLLPTVKAGLTNPSATVRTASLNVLAQVRPPPEDGAQSITAMLNDPDFGVRFRAVQALGEAIGEVSTVAVALAEKLNDPDARIRRETCASLAKLGNRASDAAPRVLEILPTKSETDKALIETLVLPSFGVKHKATFENNAISAPPEPKNPYE